VALAVARLAAGDRQLAALFQRNAGGDAAGGESGAEAAAVLAVGGDAFAGGWKLVQQQGSAAMIAGLAFGGQQRDGRPWPSQTAWSFAFRPPLVRPARPWCGRCSDCVPPFAEAGRGAVRFAVRGIDHPARGRTALGGEGVTKMMPPTPRRSSTRGMPRERGK
jgi:hypothetical protein